MARDIGLWGDRSWPLCLWIYSHSN